MNKSTWVQEMMWELVGGGDPEKCRHGQETTAPKGKSKSPAKQFDSIFKNKPGGVTSTDQGTVNGKKIG